MRVKLHYFKFRPMGFVFSYSKRMSNNFNHMVSILKYCAADKEVASATGIGFDVGVLYSPRENWFVAANAQDWHYSYSVVKTGTKRINFTNSLKLGTAYFIDLFQGRFGTDYGCGCTLWNRPILASIAHLGPISFDPHMGLNSIIKTLLHYALVTAMWSN